MTPLQQRMRDDLQLRGLSARTQEMDVRAVYQLAAPCHTSPARLTEEALRDSFLSLKHVKRLRSRVCLTTIDSCGLHRQEGPHLQVPAIDRARMLVPVRCGKGAKDRYVPWPTRPLELLRQSWTTHRQPVWLFPAPGRGGIGMAPASAPMPRSRVQDACRIARKASGLHTRASVHTLRPAWATHLLEAGVNLPLIPAY